MDRKLFYKYMAGTGELDYELYLDTPKILSAQKAYDALCNHDEMLFQIVHQVEELWMKLAAFTLLEIDDWMAKKQAFRVITLFERVNRIIRLMTEQLGLLETMSPKEYQEIRLQLGNGSGQESPGFRTILKMPRHIWDSFQKHFLEARNLTIADIYDHKYTHDDVYMVAEALAEFDEQFRKFRYHHIQLIYRSIGMDAASLKGRSVELLRDGVRTQFFPELWKVRHEMTDRWGVSYGIVRNSIGGTKKEKPSTSN
ncbi:MAG: tryptophan 2,3-dioxygenase family protein [Sphingomonadales bacterium]|jgi:tryptophan 2,3-dioxygenase